jgi:hypothetical protein
MRKLLLLILGVLMLVGCASGDNPASVVEAYFQAITADETGRLADLTCAAYEAQAMTLATSFRNTGAELQGMSCQQAGTDGDYNIVQCQGKIVVQYQAELREFPLSRYRIIQEDGAWRMCGEAS